MRRVIIESPYAGNVWRRFLNRRYARLAVRDSLLRGEAPFASHLFYTQPGVLRDGRAGERTWGMEAGFVWGSVADLVAVYVDRGVSRGMEIGIRRAQEHGLMVERRSLGRKF